MALSGNRCGTQGRIWRTRFTNSSQAGHGAVWAGPSVDMSVCERHRPQKGVDLQSELGRQGINRPRRRKNQNPRSPGEADMAWASFPCQDLSLAGAGAGLDGERSGMFWPFWKLIGKLRAEARHPKLVVLENVYGAITSHDGKDFTAISTALAKENYRFGAIVIDAVHFVPQSRPRLFIIGVRSDAHIPVGISHGEPNYEWYPQALIAAHKRLPKSVAKKWIWWKLPMPPARRSAFVDLIEDDPIGVEWHTLAETRYILDMMSDVNKAKVELAKKSKRRIVGGVYRRTRNGIQRAEVRFDDVAGCLRTPQGGSSRQTILVIENGKIRSRLLSPREAARLMGLPDSYKLPDNYNAAYHIAGDGVVVPVVRHIARNILEPILMASAMRTRKAA